MQEEIEKLSLQKIKLIWEIKRYKKKRNAVILSHNYQRGEIQDIADFVGDSLGLSQQAAATDAELIVFCGVQFMAETANILSPQKIVLHPDPRAGCPLANMITAEELREMKKNYPGAKVVCYVNSNADVKAESDVCCTSANAVKIVQSIKNENKIIFVPDKNLCAYISEKASLEMIPWNGYCHVHDDITTEDVEKAKKEHPGALFIAHPECRPEVLRMADGIFSTSGMFNFVKESRKSEFIFATEIGMLHRFKKDNPRKKFYPVSNKAICPNMKLITLEKVLNSLKTMEPRVVVPEEIRLKALQAVIKMVEIT